MPSTYQSLINLDDGRIVCLSYGVPVAAFVPGRGYVRTATRYSVTSSRHANMFAGRESPQVTAEEFRAMVAPVRVP